MVTNTTINGIRKSTRWIALRYSGVPCKANVIETPSVNTVFTAVNRTANGGPVPDFRARIAMGRDATGAYSLSVTRTSYGEVGGYAEWDGANCTGSKPPPRESDDILGGTFHVGTFPAYPDFTSLVAAAASSARGQFYQNIADLESRGSTFIGELSETMRMLRHPFASSRQLLTDYLVSLRKNARSIRRYNRSRKLRYLGDAWLEYKFGWDPLAKDVQDILDSAKRLENQVSYAKVRGFSDREYNTAGNPAEIGGPGVCARLYKTNVTRSRTFTVCRGAYRLTRFVDAPLQSISSNFGFAPSGFIPTLWNLLPWSFLIDYFSNVGDLLAAACICRGNIAWSNETQVIQQRAVQQFSQAPNAPAFVGGLRNSFSVIAHGDNVREQYTFTRVKGVEMPVFQVSLPGLKQTLNILALMAQSKTICRTIN